MKDLKDVLIPSNLVSLYLEDSKEVRTTYEFGWHKLNSIYWLFEKIQGYRSRDDKKKVLVDWLQATVGDTIPNGFIYREFKQSIHGAKDFRKGLIRDFVPDIGHFPLSSDGVVSPTIDPLTILEIMFNPPGTGILKPRRSFEALVAWFLGIRFLIMRMKNTKNEGQLRNLTLWLEEAFFTSPLVTETIFVQYNPGNENRFQAILNKPKEHCLILPVGFRCLKPNGKIVKVLYDSRTKTEIDVFSKILLKSKAKNPRASDNCGISLTFLDLDDLYAGYEILKKTIFTNDAAMTDFKIRGQGGINKNEYSSNTFPPELKFKYYAHGQLIEVQISVFENYFNRRFSLGKENHHLYKLDQRIKLLKLLFPAEFYLNDWDKLYDWLIAFQKGKITSNYVH